MNLDDFKYIDSHCHVEDKSLNKYREDIVKRAFDEKVQMVTSGTNLGSCRRAVELKEKYGIYMTLGYHPGRVNAEDNAIDKVYKFIQSKEKDILAVGEIGLDFDVGNTEKQEIIFKKFIKLAEELSKPVVIHARGMEERSFEILKNDLVSMYHCYSGSLELARELIENGNFISYSTLVCFSEHHKNLVKQLDLENIVVETDSPYLSPIKGEKNEPKNVIKVIETIWELKKDEYSLDEITKIIYNNTKRLYHI